MMNWNEFQKYCAAFCAWREARGEIASFGVDALRGVVHVIANRAKKRNQSWPQVVFAYEQFSSLTAPGDPQIKAGLVPNADDPIFAQCYDAADGAFNNDIDPTFGADFYFADGIGVPYWANSMTFTVKIGHHNFYRS